MKLIDKIEADFIAAFKGKEERKVASLRLLKSVVKNKAIELRKPELDETEIIMLIKSELKKRQESIDAFKKGGRADLVDKETAEVAILTAYLPKQMDESQIKEKIMAIRDSLPASAQDQFGSVMNASMKELKGLADGQVVSRIVKEILSPK